MCTLFYLFIYYIYVCLQNVNFLANKTLQYLKTPGTTKPITSTAALGHRYTRNN